MISIVTPTFNEEENVEELASRVSCVMKLHSNYAYEHIFIDNCSTDNTVAIIRDLAKKDVHVKAILNSRNFGHLRSPYYGMLQAYGHAVVLLTADLQDPPEIISELILKWEAGYKSVMAVKNESDEKEIIFRIRRFYYRLLNRMSESPQIKDATGAGLYDRSVMDVLRSIHDPYPYFRGLISEIGHPISTVSFKQPRRKKGITKNNFLSLYDLAVLGITKHSRIPLRIMTVVGGFVALGSLLLSMVLLLAKLVFWNAFSAGIAPLMVGLFFLSGIQMIFFGVLGEYIGNIHSQVRNMPLVIEAERIGELYANEDY